jgi:ABC-2 type transport system permease protein
MFMGISIIWERQFGFMKEILVAPISRTSIFIGKMLGVSVSSVLQGLIVIAIGFVIGVHLGFYALCATVILMLVITLGLVCIGLIIASLMKSLESYHSITTFVNMPLFFLSGALYPVANIPYWLRWLFYINPLTYGVDALRTIMMSGWQPIVPFRWDILIICMFDVVIFIIGVYTFSKKL